MEEQKKQIHVMPNTLPGGLSKILKPDDKTALNIRIIIVISIFSLILIFIGTVILLNSYTPNATKISSSQVRQTATNNNSGLSLPKTDSKSGVNSFASNIETYAKSLSADEALYEKSL